MTLYDLRNRRGILLGLALAAMTAIAYLPAMRSGGFVWDDDFRAVTDWGKEEILSNRSLHQVYKH